jgi:hypothetical protein
VGIPRPLRLIRDTASVAADVTTAVAAEADPTHVRELRTVLDVIAADQALSLVTMKTALQVPAFTKALKTYTHTIATFPLREHAGGEEVPPRSLLVQPDRNTTYWSTMTRTVRDLLAYDVAFWEIMERAWDGFPTYCRAVDGNLATQLPDGTVIEGGRTISPARLIRFDGDGLGGWLTTGAHAIHAAASLEAAAVRYAEFPLPTIILKNTGADLPPDQVDALLEAWEQARQTRATAYINSTMETKEFGFSAADLQLVDARNAAAIQIARLANLDPIWTGAGVPGSSLTYSNRVDLYRQLLDTALAPVMATIGQRLSAGDVTPRGHTVTFDTAVFLKANPSDIAGVIERMLPLGVMDIPTAQALLDLPTTGGTP